MTDDYDIVIEPHARPDPDPAARALAEERLERAERELKEAIRAWEKLVGGPYLPLMPGENLGQGGKR